jgi:hypothetical protein
VTLGARPSRPHLARSASPRSGRPKIAHRFIGGINPSRTPESVQRTTDQVMSRLQPSASRTICIIRLDPSTEVLGYYHSSASRTVRGFRRFSLLLTVTASAARHNLASNPRPKPMVRHSLTALCGGQAAAAPAIPSAKILHGY